MFCRLSNQENAIVQLFLDVGPTWKDYLITQIEHASVRRENCVSSYFIMFNVDRSIMPINTQYPVPISLVIDHCKPPHTWIFYTNEEDVTIQMANKPSPTGFNLHFEEGYLTKLEVYSLSGEPLNMVGICSGTRHYFVHYP